MIKYGIPKKDLEKVKKMCDNQIVVTDEDLEELLAREKAIKAKKAKNFVKGEKHEGTKVSIKQ
jgi:uncharacterized 2Fe-2S/4Fe-4S cluster protein (DUF4445 family)